MYNQLGQGSGHQTGPPPPPPHSAPGPTAPYMDIFGYNNFGLAIGQPLRGNPYLSAHDESAYYSRDTYGDTFSAGVETGMGALTLDFMNTDLTGQTVGTPSFQPTKPATPSVGVPQVAVPKALPGHSGIGNLFDVFKRLDSINSNSSSVGLSGSSCVVGQSIKKPSWASVASQPAKGGHGHSSATNHHYHGHHSQQSHQHHGHHSQQSQHHHGHLIQQSQHHHGHHIQQNQHHHGHFGSSNAVPQGSTGNVTGSGARRDAGNVAISVPERGTGGGNGTGSISGNVPSTGVRSGGGGARNGGSRINVGSVGTSVNPNVAGGLTNGNSIVPLDCSGQNYSPLTSGPVYPSHPILDKLRVENNYNPKEFDLSLKDARFFIIKSYSEDDIHRSIKYSIWCSTEHGNKRLDTAFKSQENKGPIYLFYSVNGSGHFCGMAQMLSMVDYNSSSNVWAQDKWKGQFKVKWIYVKDVPNAQLRHIRLENNENKPVTNSRDTQEVPYAQGKTVLKIMHNYRHTTSIFDDFLHYEKRQEEEYQRRVAGDPPPPNNNCGLSGSSNTTTANTSNNNNNNQQQQQQKTTKVLNSTKENNQF